MIILIPLLVCIVGLLMMIFCKPEAPRAIRIGEIAFEVGLLVTLLRVAVMIGILGR